MLSHEPKNYALLPYPAAAPAPPAPTAASSATAVPPFVTGEASHPTGFEVDERELILRGVAFRSSRAEPYGEAFLRRAIARLFADDIVGLQRLYLTTIAALRRREVSTVDVSSRMRLAKSPAEYAASRDSRRELAYEAMLAAGRSTWSVGERVRVYRTARGTGAIVPDDADDTSDAATTTDADGDSTTAEAEVPATTVIARGSAPGTRSVANRVDADLGARTIAALPGGFARGSIADTSARDPRDYDVDHYVRVLRDNFATRFARALDPEVYAAVFADPDQLSLFAPDLRGARAILSIV
jgi:hypothetical protein